CGWTCGYPLRSRSLAPVPSIGCRLIRTDRRRTDLTWGDATLLSSHDGDPRGAASDTTDEGQTSGSTDSLRVSSPPSRGTNRLGRTLPPTLGPTLTVRTPYRTQPGPPRLAALSDLAGWPIPVEMFDVDSALRTLIERGGSDLHVKVGVPPTVRLHGELAPLEGYQPLQPEDTEKAFQDMAEVRSLTEFEECGEADFSYS